MTPPLKQTNKCLIANSKCGEKSGSQFKHGEIYIRFRCSGMPHSSTKMLGKPSICEILHVGQELDNAVDRFAMKVVQNNKTVGHLPCEYSRVLWLSHVAEKLLHTPVRRNGDSL